MSVLPIVEVPDVRLRAMCEPVAAIDEEVRQLAADMADTMYAAKGIGLAAIQVGVMRRVVVIDLQEREVLEGDDEVGAAPAQSPQRTPVTYVNPEILWQSDELSTYSEGCLSIPEQYAEVTRPERCRVRWLDLEGASHEEEFHGLLATCMQHEIDHLNGILFIDHLSRLKRDMVLKKLAKARKAA